MALHAGLPFALLAACAGAYASYEQGEPQGNAYLCSLRLCTLFDAAYSGRFRRRASSRPVQLTMRAYSPEKCIVYPGYMEAHRPDYVCTSDIGWAHSPPCCYD
ncbi:hypothetical protein THASP1DRAFT_24940 [Thamnocephalis sphaerospora]|uniref:Uncharacterized protein n=1 Tax=Thamnocephalis sphaerospora TaxID=78915 RepID=A0A4P9XN36_9FUNG|nr:hypothetical protein THASP1DRAFT_24940 [Thamnocephalis sphaerospora]|eukprot:RKP06811.1 hypothetical protein THASP1DRAFT_24940 [Thamnocephalis sphaerospora]